MQCRQIDSVLDDYLDGLTDGRATSEVELHLSVCRDCRGTLDAAARLRVQLADLPVDGPDEAFFTRVLEQARQQQPDDASRPPRLAVLHRRVLAAAAVVLVSAGVLLSTHTWFPSTSPPVVSITLETPTPVNIVFSTMEDLKGARVSLQLPDGVELDGYSGRQMLAWTTDLRKGKNVLRLPLVAYGAPTEDLVATVAHGDDAKTFRLTVRVI